VKVLVADDHPLFRAGMRTLLDTEPRVHAVTEASTGAQAVAVALDVRPDVVVMDLHLPDLDGVEATRRILAGTPGTGVLVLTMSDDDATVAAALGAGARGYLLKEAGPAEILAAVISVAAGMTVLGTGVAHRIAGRLAGVPAPQAEPCPELTPREREILALIARGHANPAIARQLFLSPKTVRNHITSIFAKLQVQTRAEAIVRARDADRTWIHR